MGDNFDHNVSNQGNFRGRDQFRGQSRGRGQFRGRGRGNSPHDVRGRGFHGGPPRGGRSRGRGAPQVSYNNNENSSHDEWQDEQILSTRFADQFQELDKETIIFFSNVTKRWFNRFDDEEEKEIFIQNVFIETKDRELDIVYSIHNLQPLTDMLTASKSGVYVKQFMKAFETNFDLACHFIKASIITECLIFNALRLLQTEDEDETYETWMTNLTKYCCQNFTDLVEDFSGSKVLDRLFRILSGSIESRSTVSRDSITSDRSMKADFNFEKFEVKIVPASFGKLLKKLTKKLLEHIDKFYGWAMQKNTSRFLQDSLHPIAIGQPLKCQKIIRLFLAIVNENGNVEKNEKVAPEICVNASGSYFLQTCIKLASEKNSARINLLLIPHLLSLSSHEFGNYVIASMIQHTKTKETFEEILVAFVPHFSAIFQTKPKIDILSLLSSTCVEKDVCQAKFVQELIKALDIPNDSERKDLLVLLLLKMIPYHKFNEDEFQPFTYPGSRVIQNMLKFHKTDKIVASILALPISVLEDMALNSSASFVFDAFMNSQFVGDKKREKMLDKIKEMLPKLVKNKHSCNMLNSIWKAGALKTRIQLATELCKIDLRDCEFGFMLKRNFGLTYFVRSREEWAEMQQQNSVKRKHFGDIVQQFDKANSNQTTEPPTVKRQKNGV